MGFWDKAMKQLTEAAQQGAKAATDSVQKKASETVDKMAKRMEETPAKITNAVVEAPEKIQAKALSAVDKQIAESNRMKQERANLKDAKREAKALHAAAEDIPSERVAFKSRVFFADSVVRKQLDGAKIAPNIYQLDNGTITFNLKHAILWEPISMTWEGPKYHLETTSTETPGTTKVKKKRHGLGGAVLGTVLAPGLGTVVGAVAGSSMGKDVVKQGNGVTHGRTNQVEDYAPLHLKARNLGTGEVETLELSVMQKQYHALDELQLFPEPEPTPANQPEPSAAKAVTDDLATQLTKLKDLADLGVITQEEFAAKKKDLLGI